MLGDLGEVLPLSGFAFYSPHKPMGQALTVLGLGRPRTHEQMHSKCSESQEAAEGKGMRG